MKKIALVLCALALAGCALIPIGPDGQYKGVPQAVQRHQQLARSCQQAAEQGWCYAECGDKQPDFCWPAQSVTCSADGFLCVGTTKRGTLIFFAPWGGGL